MQYLLCFDGTEKSDDVVQPAIDIIETPIYPNRDHDLNHDRNRGLYERALEDSWIQTGLTPIS